MGLDFYFFFRVGGWVGGWETYLFSSSPPPPPFLLVWASRPCPPSPPFRRRVVDILEDQDWREAGWEGGWEGGWVGGWVGGVFFSSF